MSDNVGKATEALMATTRHVLDVQLWLTTVGNNPATLVMTAEQIAHDAQAQRDQAAMLLAYLVKE